jgi:translation initiation factor IF-1
MIHLHPPTMTSTSASSSEAEGRITAVHYGHRYQVEMDDRRQIHCTISSRMWKRWVRLAVGDRVQMEMSAVAPTTRASLGGWLVAPEPSDTARPYPFPTTPP